MIGLKWFLYSTEKIFSEGQSPKDTEIYTSLQQKVLTLEKWDYLKQFHPVILQVVVPISGDI